MAQAFYRKYRSKSLKEVVGQEHITDTLARALSNGTTSHAYLFTGPRGVGKTSVARILAHELNKIPYSESTQHLDVIEIDAASNRRIDDVRDLREKVHIAPTSAKYKVYIIDEVHMLTGESFNALLKTLEEPPAHAVFILATTEVHKLPATIVSRTQRFHFRPVSREDVVNHLKFISDQEGIAIEPEALNLIADYGEGSFRDSISLLDQLASMSGNHITGQFVGQSLGLASADTVDEILQFILHKEQSKLHSLLSSLEEKGVNPVVLAGQLIAAMKKEAVNHYELYSLIDALLELHKSSQPATKLMVTLLMHTASHSVDTPIKKVSVPAQAAAAPIHTVTAIATKPATPKTAPAKPSSKAKEKAASKPETEKPTAASAAVGTGTPLTSDDWVKVLSEIKRINPPVFSIIKNAEPRFEEEVLTLAFSFKLHQIKMDDNRYRTKLVECVTSLGYQCPAIAVVHDGAATAPVASVAEATAEVKPDETASSVLAMMGGGEMVNA